MRYIVTLFWTAVLGQIVGYIGAALTDGTYDFTLTTIISFIAGVVILLISAVAPRKEISVHSQKNNQEPEISQALFYFLLLTTIIVCCEELYES